MSPSSKLFATIGVIGILMAILSCKEGEESGEEGAEESQPDSMTSPEGEGRGEGNEGGQPPSNPNPPLIPDESKIEIESAGADFDFTGALAVGTLRVTSLQGNSTTAFKKFGLDGSPQEIAKAARQVLDLKKSSKNRLVIRDSDSRVVLISSDGVETEIPNVAAESSFDRMVTIADDGTVYFKSSVDHLIYKISIDSTTPTRLNNFPFDSMDLTYVTGSAVRYSGMSNGSTSDFTYFQGINFVFEQCNGGGPDSALGDVGLLYDDCSENNFAYWDGSAIVREKIDRLLMNGGAFWHPNGAVVFGQGNVEGCPFESFGLVFVDEARAISPIGCTPGLVNFGPDVTISGDLFIVKGTSAVWVFGINGWRQALLEGITVINLSLAGSTLYYDGMNPMGDYIAGKIDVITKEQTSLNFEGSIAQIIGFK